MSDGGTVWEVRSSPGLDALAFLAPLASAPLYRTYHGYDADEFSARLEPRTVSAIERLWFASQEEGFGLLGPTLQLNLSGSSDSSSLSGIRSALGDRRESLLPPYLRSIYWDEASWGWFDRNADEVASVVRALEIADFEGFWIVRQRCRDDTEDRRSRAAASAVRRDGSAASAAVSVLERDELITAIVREHDPRWGYRTLPGLLDEDLVQALDQMVGEELGIAADPADRWNRSDDGMHVLAAGLYGLLRQDDWGDRGGSVEAWLHDAADGGRLAPAVLHPSAARVLGRDVDHLWPRE